MNKVTIRQLPMPAFPHLRKICNAGFIVDEKGKNSYFIHPERKALSTRSISGGRALLVTPETSFLANKYMKLHQPCHRHERVIVEGSGHSDLLIGEESNVKVFPRIVDISDWQKRKMILQWLFNCEVVQERGLRMENIWRLGF